MDSERNIVTTWSVPQAKAKVRTTWILRANVHKLDTFLKRFGHGQPILARPRAGVVNRTSTTVTATCFFFAKNHGVRRARLRCRFQKFSFVCLSVSARSWYTRYGRVRTWLPGSRGRDLRWWRRRRRRRKICGLFDSRQRASSAPIS